MAGVSDTDIDTIAGAVGRQPMKQIAQAYLFDEGIDDLLKTWDKTAFTDTEFNKLVLEHWRKNKGGTDERLRLHTALNTAAQAGVPVNRDSFCFLLESPQAPGKG